MDSPFKFLEAYGKPDRGLFFGRDEEIADLYALVRKSNLVVVYGLSGVGKTSLVRCGLMSQMEGSEAVTAEVRRRSNLNESLKIELARLSKSKELAPEAATPAALLQKVFNRHLRPVYLFFDQFEELFILGDREEQKQFLQNLSDIRALDLPCTIVLIVRQEYLGDLTDFKKEVPFLFDYTLQVRQMDQPIAEKTVEKMLDAVRQTTGKGGGAAGYEFDFEEGTPKAIVQTVAKGRFFVELPYLQVYLDKAFRTACGRTGGKVLFSHALLQEEGLKDIETVIATLLDEQIKKAVALVGETDDAKVLALLKLFVTEKDTKQPVAIGKILAKAQGQGLGKAQVEACLDLFTNALLLRPLEGNQYELSHDSLAAKIALKRPGQRRLLPAIAGNPYKGLTAFTESEDDIRRFFGRQEAVEKVLSLLENGPLAVISGASGTGKSSLVKAGAYPELKRRGFELFEIIRPGEYPLQPLEKAIQSMKAMQPQGAGFLLLIDQYEELITRSKWEEDVERFTRRLVEIIERPNDLFPQLGEGQSVKIIITVRADFEPQFKSGPLEKYWEAGRYVVPYMSPREMETVIEGPAELAACHFEPLTLIKNIAEEVSGRPAALPLLSFALSQMYEASLPGRIITQEIYNRTGVFSALQSRANAIYEGLPDEPTQRSMRQVMLRMVSLEGSELASRRIPLTELQFASNAENERVAAVLAVLTKERLVVRGKNDEGLDYVEPAHDALLKGWTKLWDWIKAFGKENILFRERLGAAVGEWKQRGRSGDAVWRQEQQVIQLRVALDEPDNWLNAEEQAFAAASVAEVEKLKRAQQEAAENERRLRVKAEEERAKAIEAQAFAEEKRQEAESAKVEAEHHRNKAETNRAEAETQRNAAQGSAKLARRAAVVSLIGFIVAIGMAVWAVNNLHQANRAKAEADSSRAEALLSAAKADSSAALATLSAKTADSLRVVAENEKEVADSLFKVAMFQKSKAEKNEGLATLAEKRAQDALQQVKAALEEAYQAKMVADEKAKELAKAKDALEFALQQKIADDISLADSAIEIRKQKSISDSLVAKLSLSESLLKKEIEHYESLNLANDILASYQEKASSIPHVKAYQKAVAEATTYRGVWPPDKKLRLGDYGSFYNGEFKVEGNLADLGIPIKEDAYPSDGLEVKSRDALALLIRTNTMFLEIPKGDFWMRNGTNSKIMRIVNLGAVASQVASLFEKGKWQRKWLIVTELMATQDGVLAFAGKGKGELRLSTEPPFAIIENKNLLLFSGELTPLFRVMGLRKDYSGK